MPRPRNASSVGVSHCSRRAHSISDAPASASPSAISSPSPRDPPVTMAVRPVSVNKSWIDAMWAYSIRGPRIPRIQGLRGPGDPRIGSEDAVAHVQEVAGSGTFLTRAIVAADMLTRDDLTDEQKLFGQTALEFMRNEVFPNEAKLYAHD